MDSPNSHSYQDSIIETSEIHTEILDDYPQEKIFSKQASDDENSLHAGDTMLMPSIVRSRAASNSDAYQDIDPNQIFDQQVPEAQNKLTTSSRTPAANIILNFGDKLRTNFRSLINRRESVYTSHLDKNLYTGTDRGYPVQFRNRRSSANNTFSTIPNDVVVHHHTPSAESSVYDGNQAYANDLNPMDSKSANMNRSPSFGSTLSISSSNKQRLRSCSEVRGRSNLYEDKEL